MGGGGRRIRVLADVYERASGVPALLADAGVEVVVVRLAAGDSAVGSGGLVERKSVPDLHASIIGGRFWAQIGKLSTASAKACLLVEGRDLDDGSIHPNAIRGACVAADANQARYLVAPVGPQRRPRRFFSATQFASRRLEVCADSTSPRLRSAISGAGATPFSAA